MSVRSSAPPNSGMVYTVLIAIGLAAAVVGAVLIAYISYEYVTRIELREPEPKAESHAAIPAWVDQA